MSEIILKMNKITKYIYDSYGKALKNTTVKILDEVDFDLKKGEVHILVGENGAGKSTLMKTLGGIIPPDFGEIILEDKNVHFRDAKESRNNGISFIHQELNLCSNLDVAHNIFLGREPIKYGVTNKKMMYEQSGDLIKSLGFDISPKTLLRDLSTAQQQVVEIAKAFSYKSKIIIMDEPTASLTKKEIDLLFKLINEMKQNGISIIYISHRFEEIVEIGDRISVLRDGKYIGTMPMKEFNREELIKMMVGRNLGPDFTCRHKVEDKILFEAKDLKLSSKTEKINLHVNPGEIVGLGGLVGSGRTELAKSIFGARKYYEGKIYFSGKKLPKLKPSDLIKLGIAYLSEGRKTDGLILSMDINTNITMASLGAMFRNGIIFRKKENKTSDMIVKQLKIVSQSIYQNVGTLSGGNQQRVSFGKWITTKPKLLILDEPTRGIDINAKIEIYKIIDEIACNGVGVIMISSELPELIRMSDRIYVMKQGTIAGEIKDKKDMIQENILSYTIGV